MSESGFTLFDTQIGACGIGWRSGKVIGLQLPEASHAAGWTRLRRRYPELDRVVAPEWIDAIVGRIGRLLAGESVDLSDVPLDFVGVGVFEASVYRAAQAIPPGRTISYGVLAAELGDPGQARAVGQALGRNPWPIVVPCHRVTAAEGRTGGFSAPGGISTKLRLLEIEGALKVEGLPLFASGES